LFDVVVVVVVEQKIVHFSSYFILAHYSYFSTEQNSQKDVEVVWGDCRGNRRDFLAGVPE